MITHERLLQLVSYDPQTGVMRWKLARRKCTPGVEVGRFQRQGYRQVYIEGRAYYVHVLAVFYMTGEWPPHDIDHRNADKDDNRWLNLRPATRSQNKANCPKQSNNKVGLKGISWSMRDRKFSWSVKRGDARARGASDCPAAAHLSCIVESHKLFGEFARST